ncbi:MAG TPA: type VII secretion integral membrane protein EccD [Phycicoccus sp.]|nr:type VII secretion integral membrane protein EccD [Phycicoccus sp.]
MSASTGIGSLIRLSVTAGTRRADLGVPSGLPVAELLPDLAREVGVLDAEWISAAPRLLRADGTALDLGTSLSAQGVSDGAVLLLAPAAAREKVYDDVVEAVADLVETRFTPWSALHASLTAIGAAVTFFLVAAYALFASRSSGLLVAAVAACAAALLLGAGAVLVQARRQLRAGAALAATAVVYAAVAGFAVRADAPLWGEGLVYAGLGGALAAAGGAALTARLRAPFLSVAASAAALALMGAVSTWLGVPMRAVCAVAFVVAAILACLLPWIGVSSSRLSGRAPKSDLEIWADVPPVDPTAVARQLDRGHEAMLGVGLATGLGMLACAVQLVASGLWGTMLVLAGFAAVLLGTRHARTRTTVALAMATGIAGVALAAVAAVSTQPSWRAWVTLGLALTAALVVALALVLPRTRVRLGRVADALEGATLVALVPLAWFAAGLL